jgi:hypothetical protein
MPNNVTTITEIWVDKNELSHTKSVELSIDTDNLGPEQVLLNVDSFGFSANNITYALFGEKMGYWGFFPAAEGWGKVPVWGFATVVVSNHSEVQVGEKVFGYLPMASHLVITAGKTSDSHFYDIDSKRRSISPVYDNYVRCAKDPGYQADKEAWQLNYRPLFMTSFVLDDYVGEGLLAAKANGENVKRVILTSASSKTAYGAAHLLMKHKAERGLNYQVIGLTSAHNKSFTADLGCYDEVLSYEQVEQISTENSSWVLDFAGNKPLLLKLQSRLGAKLILIGSTDVDAQQDKPQGTLESEFFFAPAQVKKRSSEWGHQGFALNYAKAWQSFAKLIENTVEVVDYQGSDAIDTIYKQALQGKLSNGDINVLRF